MINLNNKNGNLKIDHLIITNNISIQEFIVLFQEYSIELLVDNSGWKSYRVFNIEQSFLIYFYKNRLKTIDISPKIQDEKPFEINAKKKIIVKNFLVQLGGEKKYDWGEVLYSEDVKGGDVSIIINYN